jgi:hypothetical protein
MYSFCKSWCTFGAHIEMLQIRAPLLVEITHKLAPPINGGIFLGNIYGYTNAARDVANNCIVDQAFVIQGRVFDCDEHVPPTPARADRL